MGNYSMHERPKNDGARAYFDIAEIMRGLQWWTNSYLNDENYLYSGWKIHVFSTSVDDIIRILNRIYLLIERKKIAMKAANFNYNNQIHSMAKKEHIQFGKGITIYLPYAMIKNKEQRNFKNELASDLGDYDSRGTIHGDKQLGSGRVHYRYEYRIPFSKLPDGGVNISYVKRNNLYVLNDGGLYDQGFGEDIFIRK